MRSNVTMRLQPSLLAEAHKVAAADGATLDQLINVPLAEKLPALRTESYFTISRNGRRAPISRRRCASSAEPVSGSLLLKATNHPCIAEERRTFAKPTCLML